MGRPIPLGDVELGHGALVGVVRQLVADTYHRPEVGSRLVKYEARLLAHIRGAWAEAAYAKAADQYWESLRDTERQKLGDVGEIEVRWTVYPTGHLILRPRDPPERVYVLVTGEPETLEYQGWIRGSEGMLAANRSGDAWYVAQEGLHKVAAEPADDARVAP